MDLNNLKLGETLVVGADEPVRALASEIRHQVEQNSHFQRLERAKMAKFNGVKWSPTSKELVIEVKQPDEDDFKRQYDMLDEKEQRQWESMEELGSFLFGLRDKILAKNKWVKNVILCERSSSGNYV